MSWLAVQIADFPTAGALIINYLQHVPALALPRRAARRLALRGWVYGKEIEWSQAPKLKGILAQIPPQALVPPNQVFLARDEAGRT